MTFQATRIHPQAPVGDTRLCKRCGFARTVNRSRTSTAPLCTDCRYVLTRQERKAWAA